jgi:hypothetical protein
VIPFSESPRPPSSGLVFRGTAKQALMQWKEFIERSSPGIGTSYLERITRYFVLLLLSSAHQPDTNQSPDRMRSQLDHHRSEELSTFQLIETRLVQRKSMKLNSYLSKLSDPTTSALYDISNDCNDESKMNEI